MRARGAEEGAGDSLFDEGEVLQLLSNICERVASISEKVDEGSRVRDVDWLVADLGAVC